MPNFETMTVDEAIKYCYEHEDEYIRECFDSISEGVRAFECLISILEGGTITPSQLPEYGMEY